MPNITGFTVGYDGHSVVTVFKMVAVPEAFDSALQTAHDILDAFPRSKTGSTWGCDGIGYEIQKKRLVVEVKKSGVGPRKYKAAMAALQANHSS